MPAYFEFVFKEAGSLALGLEKHILLYPGEPLCFLLQSNSVAHHYKWDNGREIEIVTFVDDNQLGNLG